MGRYKIMALRFVVNVIFCYLWFQAYLWGINYGMRLMQINFWFVEITLGILGITIGAALFEWVRKYFLFLLKSCDIWSVCHPECSGVLSALKGVHGRFLSTYSIPIFNKLIRSVLQEIGCTISEATEGTVFNNVLDRLLATKLGKCSKIIVIKMLDNLDECILGYCYRNQELPLAKATIRALTIFFQAAPKILAKLSVALAINILFQVFYTVISIALAIKFGVFNLRNIVLYYVAFKGLYYVLKDSFLDPMLLNSILTAFFACDDMVEVSSVQEQDLKIESLRALIPSLDKLYRMLEQEIFNS